MKAAYSVHRDPAATPGAEEWILAGMALERHSQELEPCGERPRRGEALTTGYTAWGSDVEEPVLAAQRPTTASGCLRRVHYRFASVGALGDVWREQLRASWQPFEALSESIVRLGALSDVWREQLRASWQPLQTFSESIHGTARLLSGAIEKYTEGPTFVEAANREIQEVLERGQLQDARTLATWASAKRPDSRLLARWAALLKPGRTRAAGPASGRPRRAEATWLRQHASDYAGQWIALDGDRLIATSASLSEVRRMLREVGCAGQALLHFVPREFGA